MSEKNIYTAIKVLAVIGIILACYLLFEQFTLSPFRPCSISATINCDAVIIGAVSKTLGLPTPLYGLLGYIVILLAAVYKKKKLLLGTALFGLLFCLRIASVRFLKICITTNSFICLKTCTIAYTRIQRLTSQGVYHKLI